MPKRTMPIDMYMPAVAAPWFTAYNASSEAKLFESVLNPRFPVIGTFADAQGTAHATCDAIIPASGHWVDEVGACNPHRCISVGPGSPFVAPLRRKTGFALDFDSAEFEFRPVARDFQAVLPRRTCAHLVRTPA